MIVNKTTKSVSILAVALFLLAAASLRSSAQTVKSQIQRMSGWQNCVACAGANAAGPGASISTATTSSPSMSGVSRVFSIASSNPYADALWWKQLGAANGAYNLQYDVDFYLTRLRTPRRWNLTATRPTGTGAGSSARSATSPPANGMSGATPMATGFTPAFTAPCPRPTNGTI